MRKNIYVLMIVACILFGFYQIIIGNNNGVGYASFIFAVLVFIYDRKTSIIELKKRQSKENRTNENANGTNKYLCKLFINKRKVVKNVCLVLVVIGLIFVFIFGRKNNIDEKEASVGTITIMIPEYDPTITDQEFAEYFCEKVQVVLLGSEENRIDVVLCALNELKNKYHDTIEMEQRYAYTLSQCGLIYFQQGYIYDASIFTNEALAFAQELEPSKDNCALISLCYSNSATVLLAQGYYFDAETYFLTAINYYKQFRIYNTELASTYMSLASYYIDVAKYSEALENIEEADNVLNQLKKSDSMQMGVSHIIRARIYQHINQGRVLDELLIAKDILENNKPVSNMYLASLYGDLGAYYRPINIKSAEDYFLQELEIAQNIQGEFGEDTIDAEINLASIYSDYGRIQEARSKLNDVVIKCEGRYSERKIDLAHAYVRLANVYGELDQYAKSIDYYNQAKNIFEAEYGTNYPILATVYGGKASVLMKSGWGQEQEAFKCLKDAIKILEYNHGDSQSDMAELLLREAELYREQGELEKAIPLLEEAKQIYKMLYGEICNYVIEIDLMIGNIYVMLQNKNSYSYLYYAVARYESMYGETSYRIIEPYIMLGDCYYYGLGEGSEQSQKEKAIDCYNKAEEILELFDNINTKENAYLYEKLGTAWYMLHSNALDRQRKGDMRKALLCYKKAQDIHVIREQENSGDNLWLTTRIGRIYAYLDEEDMAIECLEFVENHKDSIDNENEQLKIYLDMLGICVVLNDGDKCREYANFLKSIIDASPTTVDAIGDECVNWINEYAD